MLNSNKMVSKLLLLTISIVVLFTSTLAFASLNGDEYTSQFSVESFEVVPLETDSKVLRLNETSELASIEHSEEKLERTLRANSNLMQSFFKKQPADQKYREGNYSVSGITKEGFPDIYAGAYVNPDLNLVVLLTESTIKEECALQNAQKSIVEMAESNYLIFASAKYSYNHLVSLMDNIYQHIHKNDEKNDYGFSVVYYAIDDYRNCVIVGLEDITEKSIDAFKTTVVDSDALRFEVADADDVVEDSSTLNAGGAINLGSVGYRVRKYDDGTWIYGFITAAHCYSPGDYVYDDGSKVGQASDLWQNSGNIDAVFIYDLDKYDYSVSNTIAYIGGTHEAAIDANLAQGHPITMVGKTTQGENGTVQSISYSFGDFTDFGASNYNRSSGDSGGIVLSTRITGKNYIAGIHKGYYSTYSIFTKAINIASEFGLGLH